MVCPQDGSAVLKGCCVRLATACLLPPIRGSCFDSGVAVVADIDMAVGCS